MTSDITIEPAVRVRNEFEFDIQAPFKTTAPLFGPDRERAWARDSWDPRFVYPAPGRDVEGAVFTLDRGDLQSTWINTVFDLEEGRMQYVYFIPNAFVTRIDISLRSSEVDRTHVHVVYERTALRAGANKRVQQLGAHDRHFGVEWQKAIEEYLRSERASSRS